MLKDICPGCPHHCYLDEAHCERGVEYAATGVLPPRKPRPAGEHSDRRPNERKMMYRALDQTGKLLWSIRELAELLNAPSDAEQPGSELFSCLREDDRAALLTLLEKVRLSQRRH